MGGGGGWPAAAARKGGTVHTDSKNSRGNLTEIAEKQSLDCQAAQLQGLGPSIISEPQKGGRSQKQTLQLSLYSTARSAGNACAKADPPIGGRSQGTAGQGVFGAFPIVSEADDLVIISKPLSAAASETTNSSRRFGLTHVS